MVTLHHFTDPLWLAELVLGNRSGCADLREVCPQDSGRAQGVLHALVHAQRADGLCLEWLLAGNSDSFPPERTPETGDAGAGKPDSRTCCGISRHPPASTEARVGFAHHYRSMPPSRLVTLDQWAANNFFSGINLGFASALADGVMKSPIGSVRIPEAKGTQDYFGFNYYTREYVTFDLTKPDSLRAQFFRKDAEMSDHGFSPSNPTECLKA